MERTIPQLFEESARKYSGNILMWEKVGESYRGSTYAEIRQQVYEVAAGFAAAGIKKGDRIALISEGRNDWVVCELAILYVGAISVPLSIKLTELSELKFRLAHSGCVMAIVSRSQAPKVQQLKGDLPDLERIVMLDPADHYDADETPLSALNEQGRSGLGTAPGLLDALWQGVAENDLANICYTSGTTADPKGVMVTHRNYTANVEQASALLPIPQDYCSLLILPWDHCFAHTAGIYTLMRNGASMASVQVGKTALETLKNIPQNIRESHPTFLLSVPTLAKNFRKNIEGTIRQKGALASKLFDFALANAYEYFGSGWDKGAGVRKIRKPMHLIFDRIIFSKIREAFGGRLEFFIGGGALLDIELQRFFYAIGMPMYQGYGLSEASPIISANVPARHKLGSSGGLVPNLDLRICDETGKYLPPGAQGEIVVRGENVMAGYWKNEKSTAETVRNGWLYTGDRGYIDSDGFLFVLGRDKSLLISNDGEKYSPEGIEETICSESRFIEQLMLYNNQSPYTVALVVPDRDAIMGWLRGERLSPSSEAGARTALDLIQSEIDRYREGGRYGGRFAARWLPAAIAVLGEGFTEQNRFLNSTLKMVRGRITEFYRSRLDFLFTTEGKSIFNRQNLTIINRWGD